MKNPGGSRLRRRVGVGVCVCVWKEPASPVCGVRVCVRCACSVLILCEYIFNGKLSFGFFAFGSLQKLISETFTLFYLSNRE